MTLLVGYAVAGVVVVGLGLESGRASGELGLRDRGQQGHEGGEGGSGESAGPVHVEDADNASGEDGEQTLAEGLNGPLRRAAPELGGGVDAQAVPFQARRRMSLG